MYCLKHLKHYVYHKKERRYSALFLKTFNNLLEKEKSKNKSNTVLTNVDVLQNAFFFFFQTFLKITSNSERGQRGNNF
jgi:hypothetical protein